MAMSPLIRHLVHSAPTTRHRFLLSDSIEPENLISVPVSDDDSQIPNREAIERFKETYYSILRVPEWKDPDAFAERNCLEPPDEVLVSYEVAWGRDLGPAILFDFYRKGLFADHPGALSRAVAYAWSSVDLPQETLRQKVWLDMFRGARCPMPDGPLTVYRGSTRKTRNRMAWTTDFEVAKFFAESDRMRTEPAYIFQAVADPADCSILCVIDLIEWKLRPEHEVVCIPSRLRSKRQVAGSFE